MIRTIVFDLGKVLLDFNIRLISERLARYCRSTPDEIHRMIFMSPLEKQIDQGAIDPHDFFDVLKERLSLRMKYEDFVPVWCDIFTEIPGMKGLIDRLAGNYPLALLSNTNQLHFDYILNQYPFVRNFDHSFLSFRLKESKPSPAIYRAVIDGTGLSPRDLFYFDDIAEYVNGARHAGIPAVRFESAAQAARRLGEGGICL